MYRTPKVLSIALMKKAFPVLKIKDVLSMLPKGELEVITFEMVHVICYILYCQKKIRVTDVGNEAFF